MQCGRGGVHQEAVRLVKGHSHHCFQREVGCSVNPKPKVSFSLSIERSSFRPFFKGREKKNKDNDTEMLHFQPRGPKTMPPHDLCKETMRRQDLRKVSRGVGGWLPDSGLGVGRQVPDAALEHVRRLVRLLEQEGALPGLHRVLVSLLRLQRK